MGSLVLVRHSVTDASQSGRNLGRRGDPPLTEAGATLAARLADVLAIEIGELPHDELRLVTSPARRCRQTAEPVALRLGIGAVEVAEELIEIDYGAWDGLTADECRRRDPELRARWEVDPWATRCPDGESGADVAARAFPILDAIEAWAAGSRDRCAVVVAHNHVNRLRLCAHMGWPMSAYRDRIASDPAGYSLLTFGSGLSVVRRLNAAPA